MGKVIYSITAAVASMLGQVYDENAKTVTETKMEKIAPVTDTLPHNSKKEIHTVLVPNKKQIPS